MRIGQGDQLTLAGRERERHRPVQRAAVSGDKCRGDEERGRVRGRGEGQHLIEGGGVAADETVEEEGLVRGHKTTVAPGADDALTAGSCGESPAWGRSVLAVRRPPRAGAPRVGV